MDGEERSGDEDSVGVGLENGSVEKRAVLMIRSLEIWEVVRYFGKKSKTMVVLSY